MQLPYDALKQEIEAALGEAHGLILATSAGDKVTARMMACLYMEEKIWFSTRRTSEKVAQLRQNPQVAFAADNLQIEAVATLMGHPDDHPAFQAAYRQKYALYAAQYESTPEDVLVCARIKKAMLYKYLDGPCKEVWLPGEKRAERVPLG